MTANGDTGDVARVEIARLGHLGDGIGPGPVYVPRTLPREVVTGRRDGAQIVEPRIETPSPDRVRPPCPHYRSCGGCKLQHASDGFVAEWKVDVLRTALAAHGLDAPMRPIHTSPPRSRRRAVLSARRTKKGALVGFHAPASDQIVAIPECHLLHPDLMAALPVAEALARTGGSRKGEMSLGVTRSVAGLDVAVTGGKELTGPLRAELAQLCGAHGLARLSWHDGDGFEVVAMRSPPAQTMGRAQVVPPPGAFLQATEDAQAVLVAAMRESTDGASRIIDLFSGAGTLSLPLAEHAEVHAVEGDAEMVAALDAGWRKAPGLKRVTTEARDLFRRPLLPDELRGASAIVLDPPRAGAEAQVAELARATPPRIGYVSCNPVTFARDAAVLVAAGYTLDWVQPVDQFRWSPHVEMAAQFRHGRTTI